MGQPDGTPTPKIRTDRRRRPATFPINAKPAISHPVPPLPEERVRLRAAVAEATEMSLSADRTNYLVSENEFPSYAVTNAVPNQQILWSLRLNDIEIVKDQPFDAVTDNEGNWSGRGSQWTAGHIGFWVVVAKTADREASVRFLVSADFSHDIPVPPQEMLGVTHVAGLYRFATPGSDLMPEFFLVEGAKHVRNLGARHVFVYLSPQYRKDYQFDDFGPVDYTALASLAASPAYRKLFDLPFETFVVTTYTFANWNWVQSRDTSSAVPLNADAERDELAELVRHLIATYPSKRFILKNWEGDWQMKVSFDPSDVATEEQVKEFIVWLQARQNGVSLGRGLSQNATVQHGIEFNQVDQAQRGVRSMLASVIPAVPSDLIAYSAWWSLGRPGLMTRNIRDDISFIRSFPGIGNRPLIITEFGFSYQSPALGDHTDQAVDAFSSAGIAMAFYWEIFDSGPNFALIGPQATRFESWRRLRDSLGVRNEATFIGQENRLPQRIVAGRQYPVTISVRNGGNLFDPVVGYALGLADGQSKLEQVIWVRGEVDTGEAVTLEFTLQAPSTAGTYVFRMFQHGVEYFGEQLPIEVHLADAVP